MVPWYYGLRYSEETKLSCRVHGCAPSAPTHRPSTDGLHSSCVAEPEETDRTASLRPSAAMERPYFKQPTENVPALGDVVRTPPLSI